MNGGLTRAALPAVFLAALLVASVAAAPERIAKAADPDLNYTTWGAGADGCGQWQLVRKKNTALAYYVHAQWIQGYITAFNAWNHDGDDIAEGIEPEQLFGWIDRFCEKYPGETVANASLALMQALVAHRAGAGKIE